MRYNAQRIRTLQREFITDISEFLGKNNIEEIEFARPFVINLDVTSPSGDDWGTEALVVTNMKNDGSVYANSEDVSNQPVKLSELSLDELAFILDEIQDGSYKILDETLTGGEDE